MDLQIIYLNLSKPVTARSYEHPRGRARARARGYTYTGTHTRMQHRRERPTPRRQTHPPETPQTHLHPPSRPALASPSFKPFLPPGPARVEASQSQPPFRKPTPPSILFPGILRPLLPPSLRPRPLCLLSVLSNRGSSLLYHSSRPDRSYPPRAPTPVRQPTTPTYRSDPRAISKIIPYILELWRTILLILILLLHGG